MPKRFQTISNGSVYLTGEGKALLEAELLELVDVRRPEIAATILAAREDGDLKENGAYHDAKDRQGVMEGRIRLIEAKLAHAEVIAAPGAHDAVGLGSTVTIVDPAGAESRYTIVGSMEAKVAAGRISNESPLGKALVGRRAGDAALVRAPGGETVFTISTIE